MENSNVNRLSFGASVVAKLSSLIMLVLQFYCGLIFYNGIVSYFCNGVGFANGVDFVDHGKYLIDWAKNVFSKNVDVYPGLIEFLHAVILVVVLVNFLISFVRFFGLFFGKEDKLLRNHKNTFVISKKFIGSSVWMLLYMIIASWAIEFRMLNSAKLLIIVVCAGILVSRLARCVLSRTPFFTFVCQIFYCAIMFAIIGMIMTFASKNVVTEVSFNINLITSAKDMSTKDLLPIIFETAAYVVAGLMMLDALAMVKSCKSNIAVPNKNVKRAGVSVLIFSIIYVVLTVLATKEFGTDVLKGYAVFVLIGVAAFLFGKIEPKLEKGKKNNDDADPDAEPTEDEGVDPASEEAPAEEALPAEEPEQLPEAAPEEEPVPTPSPKILFIGKRVKKIKGKKYRNRKDINVLVIPESVAYIEGYAFFGCTEITEIHCERKEKPRFWHNQWNFGCPAKVVWDSANSTAEE